MVAFIRAPRGSLKPRRPTSDRSQALRCPTLHIAALRLRAQPSLDELAYRIPGFTSAPKWRDGAWPASISRNRRSKATSTRIWRSRNRAASPSSNNRILAPPDQAPEVADVRQPLAMWRGKDAVIGHVHRQAGRVQLLRAAHRRGIVHCRRLPQRSGLRFVIRSVPGSVVSVNS